jgi:hypothetical protein
VRNLLSLVLYPKRVCFASLMLSAKYWEPRLWASLTRILVIPRKVMH